MTTSTRSRYLTLGQLRRVHACSEFVSVFRSLFPGGKVRVTERNAMALAQWANFYFLESYILTPKQGAVFQKAQDDGRHGRHGRSVRALRALVPGFDDLPYPSRDALNDAFREAARVENNNKMARDFVLAYNSPKK